MSQLQAKVSPIKDADHFAALIGESDKTLLVIDCHQKWCGPCDTVKPTYNSLLITIDDCQQRVQFLTANLADLKPQLTALIESSKTSDPIEFDLTNHGCMPFFLLVKDKNIVEAILGADVPKLKEKVIMHAPPLSEEEGGP